MKLIYIWLCLALAAILSLTSCDPLSSVDYKVYNMTEDTVTITMYPEIMDSSYEGYSIEENDSVTTRYGAEDSVYVAVLAPQQILMFHDDWDGLYREDWVIPVWRYFKSIKVGDQELDSKSWKTESAWHLKTEGGGRFEGESRYYDLFLRGK